MTDLLKTIRAVLLRPVLWRITCRNVILL